jgi:hypothetical protein
MKNKKLIVLLVAVLLVLLCVGTAHAAICSNCRGVGWNVCPRCGGAGEREDRNGDYVECGSCKDSPSGPGKITCFPCGGTGQR